MSKRNPLGSSAGFQGFSPDLIQSLDANQVGFLGDRASTIQV